MGATIDELLAAARSRIRRYEPADVPAEAVIIDIRAADARSRRGLVPGALHIPRTVLEWRVAPESEWRNPHLTGEEHLVVLCDHGFSSSFAAASLCELGLDAGDVIGGFDAWVEAGRQVKRVAEPWTGLPCMGPPD